MSGQTKRVTIEHRLISDPAVGTSLHGDLYHIDESNLAGRPAVVLVFGGSWRTGDPSQQKVYGLTLAQAGFVCLATEYRPSTAARWPAQLHDVQTAVRYLRMHAEELNIDPQRIAVSGNSSGGHLALMAGCDVLPGGPGWSKIGVDSSVSAVCAFYPPTSLVNLDDECDDDAVAALMGDKVNDEDYERASPMAYVTAPWPPVLLICGDLDKRVPVHHTQRLYDALHDAGNAVELHLFAQQGHAFDADREMARTAATIMINFFRRYL